MLLFMPVEIQLLDNIRRRTWTSPTNTLPEASLNVFLPLMIPEANQVQCCHPHAPSLSLFPFLPESPKQIKHGHNLKFVTGHSEDTRVFRHRISEE